MGEYHVIEELIPGVRDSLKRIEDALQVRAPSRPGEVTFTAQGVQPPTQFYVTQDFQIRVRSVTSQTAEVLTVTANILVDNRVVPVSTSSPAFTNAVNTTILRVSATGFLVSCSLQATVATLRCQTYAVVELLDQNGTFQNTLFAGYVTTVKPLAYPPIAIEESVSGIGLLNYAALDIVTFPQHATLNVPVNRVYKVVSLWASHTTSVVVDNRYFDVLLETAGGGQLGYLSASTNAQPASTTYQIAAVSGVGVSTSLAGTLVIAFSLPQFLYLSPAYRISLRKENADAADVWNAGFCTATFEEYLTL